MDETNDVTSNVVVIARCSTVGCHWQGIERSVGMLSLGQGVYQYPQYRCECGWDLAVIGGLDYV